MEQNDNNIPSNQSMADLLAGVILIFVTVAVFLPVIHHGFINYDDHLYITKNNMVLKGLTLESIHWAFTDTSAGFWFPLTWLSHIIDCQIFGLNPGGHHFSSLVIHAANTVLLFFLLKKISNSFFISLLSACIFAFHPLNVEPVAWSSSKKDLLSTFFFLLSMRVYLTYSNQRSLKTYLILLAVFTMGLMAKSMIVTLPVIFIFMDLLFFWKLKNVNNTELNAQHVKRENFHSLDKGKIKNLIIEKIPFFILSLILISVTFIAEKKYGALISTEEIPPLSRIVNIFINYFQYLKMYIFPTGLSVHYPPNEVPSIVSVFNSIFIFFLITFISFKNRYRHPYLLFGWAWYVITLIPVIGLVKIGSHSIADRYCYVPTIGLSLILSQVLYSLWPGLKDNKKGILLTSIILIPLIALSSTQLSYWKNDMTLFGHAVRVNDNNLLAHNNLAFALANNGRPEDAVRHYNKALGLEKLRYEVYFNLGMAFQSMNNYEEAINNYKASLSINPDYLNAALNLGTVFFMLKKYDEASECFMDVLRINPNQAGAYNNLGAIMARQNNIEEAIKYFNMALRIDRHNVIALKNLNRLKKGADLK